MSMQGIKRLSVEVYECSDCDTYYELEVVWSNWRCPRCNNHIHINATTQKGEQIALIRKQALELEIDDLYLRPLDLAGKCYTVLGKTINANGKIAVGLKGRGREVFSPDAAVTVRIGTWR